MDYRALFDQEVVLRKQHNRIMAVMDDVKMMLASNEMDAKARIVFTNFLEDLGKSRRQVENDLEAINRKFHVKGTA